MKKLIIALAIFVVLAMIVLVVLVGSFVDKAVGADYESIQTAVQPAHCVEPWADSLGVGDSIYVRPAPPVDGFTFATSEACSLRVYSSRACVIGTHFMHFESDECFEFPAIAPDSLLAVNKSAAKAFLRIWFWRR
jgi:hypothetical protein